MKNSRAIVLRKVAAGLFLALFFFIHVVKLMHHHPLPTTISKGFTTGTKVSASSDCSICDFQVAKDSDAATAAPLLQTLTELVPSYSFYNTPFLTSIGSTSSGRGPPSLS